MRNIKLTITSSAFLIIAILLFSSCSKELRIYSDYSQKGEFLSYSSFGFLNNKDSNANNSFTSEAEKIIYRRLRALGYRHEPNNPDLIVSCSWHNKEVTVPGFSQAKLNQWTSGTAISSSDPMINSNRQLLRNLPKGALLISFFDRTKGFTIWQGYAGGLPTRNRSPQASKVQAAATLILDQYNIASSLLMASTSK